MTRFLLLALALAAGPALAQDSQTDGPVRDGPVRVTSLDAPLLVAADGAEVWVAAGTYTVGRLDTRVRLVADGGTVRLTGRSGPEAADVPLAPATAEATALGVPFPNPFSRTATVPLALAQAGDVDVRVFDVLGREVSVLAEGPRPAGALALTLDADDLANGIYVVRATVRTPDGATFEATRRLTLAR